MDSKYLTWIIDKKEVLSIYKIEKELKMPEGTLKKFVDGRRGLPEKWHQPVINWVKKFKR